MGAINTVTVSGRLTADPETKIVNDNFTVVRIGLAHNESRKGPDGNYIDTAHFFDCAAYNNFGLLLAKKLRKGDTITVGGKLRYSSWETEEGNKRSKIEIIINDIAADAMYRTNGDTPPNTAGQPDDDGIPF